MTETQRAAMQAALAALERARAYVYETERPQIDASMDDLRAALAEQDAEPVAWWVPGAGPYAITADAQRALEPPWEPLYTAPPRREWVSLTDEEIESLADATPVDELTALPDTWHVRMARAIEASLRAKNGGGE